MAKLRIAAALGFGLIALTRVASADPDYTVITTPVPADEPGAFDYGWYDPYVASGIGVGVTIGGGVAGFTDQQMRNELSSSVAGLWDARVSVGTHVPVGIDFSYVGTAGNLNTFTGASNGTLVGSVAEAALRFNFMPHYFWTPYMFAGVGYQRYDVNGMKFATSDSGIRDSENLIEYPMGAGLSFRGMGGFTVDVRGTFRAEPSSSLVRDVNTDTFASAHWWEASGALGYEF